LQIREGSPARIQYLVVVPRLVIKANPAFGTQTLTIFPAHRLEGQRSHYRIPQHRLKIDLIVLDSTLLFIVSLCLGHVFRVEEKLLHSDALVIRKGIQAAAAFALDEDIRGSRYQNSFVYGLQLQVQLHGGTFLDANERHTKISWCWHLLFQGPHAAWAAPKVLDIDSQRGAVIAFDENS